jgi:WD40 repeat protein
MGELGSQPGLKEVVWSPDGHHIAALNRDGTVLLWDLRDHTGPVALPGGAGHYGPLVFSADGTRLASARGDDTIHIWDIATLKDPIQLRGHRGGTLHVAFSADNRQLLSTGNDDTLRVWTIGGNIAPLELTGFRALAIGLVTLSGERYISAHYDGTLRIWRCPACAPIDDVLAHVDDHVTRNLTEQERRTYLSAN